MSDEDNVISKSKDFLQSQAQRFAVDLCKGQSRAALERARATVPHELGEEFVELVKKELALRGIRLDIALQSLEDNDGV